jgi:outer membrane receptor for ferrienterochelin and colicins
MIVVFYATYAVAQTKSDTAKTIQQLQDVIVTGQYGEGSISKSVYKVRVIDQNRIQLLGANNLKDVLTNELNVRVTNDPSLGSSMSIQGISGLNVKIMIDGVAIIGREGGVIDLNQINLNNIERIELVEGPMSVNFGTDALGGVINLITKKSTKGIHVGATTYYETIGKYNGGVNGGFSANKWTIQTNIARNFFDGYSPDESTRVRLWKPSTQYFGDLSIGHSIKEGSLRYTINAFNEKVTFHAAPEITPYYAYAKDQYFYSTRNTHSLFYDQKITKKDQLNIVGSYNFYKRIRNTIHKDLVTLEEQPVLAPFENDTTYFYNLMSRGTHSHQSANGILNYQTGYEVNHDENKGNRIADGKQNMSDINAFGSMEIRVSNRLLIRPGLRLIYNSNFNAPIIPSLNIKWELTDRISIRGSYGKGFRAPSLKEMYLSFVDPNHNVYGNEQLKAETQNNFQFSSTIEWKETNRVFRIEPALFYNHIQNKIDLVMVNLGTAESRYDNISDFKSTGVNINTEYRAPNYAFILGYALTGINNALINDVSSSSNAYFFGNEVRSSIIYTFTKPELTISLFYKFNGKQRNYQYDLVSGDIINGYIESYQLFDLSLHKNFLKKRLTITTGVKNIFNVVNINANIPSGIHSSGGNSASVGMGRSIFISCAYNLAWNQK